MKGPTLLGLCEHWPIVDGDEYVFDARMYLMVVMTEQRR